MVTHGKTILFTRTADRSSQIDSIFVMNAEGTNVRKLGRGIAAGSSPNGSTILYTQSAYSPLFVMNSNGSHKHRIMNIAGSDPDWR